MNNSLLLIFAYYSIIICAYLFIILQAK